MPIGHKWAIICGFIIVLVDGTVFIVGIFKGKKVPGPMFLGIFHEEFSLNHSNHSTTVQIIQQGSSFSVVKAHSFNLVQIIQRSTKHWTYHKLCRSHSTSSKYIQLRHYKSFNVVQLILRIAWNNREIIVQDF